MRKLSAAIAGLLLLTAPAWAIDLWQSITNKTTLTAPYGSADYIPLVRGGVTYKVTAQQLATLNDTQTLSNKTINCANNTCTNLPIAQLTGLVTNAIYKAAGTYTPSALTDNGSTVSSTLPVDLTSVSLTTEIANAGVTGTTVNKLAKLTGAPSTAVISATTDTDNAVGIVIAGAGTTGNAQIALSGQASCVFDGATTAGNYVTISTSVAGDCHDGGATRPTSQQTIGRVLSTNGSGGTYAMIVGADFAGSGGGGGGGSPGGLSGDIQYNNGGVFGGLTPGASLTTGAGVLNVATAGVSNAMLANSSVTIGTTSLSLGGTAATVAALTLTASPSLALRDTSAAFDVTLGATSSTPLAAGRSLTLDVVNGARTLKLGSNLTIASDPGAVSGAMKSNGTGTFGQAACADLSNGATGCSTATGTSGATIPLLNGTNTWSGAQSFNSSDLILKGATSGTITLNAAATAGSNTLTLPAGTTNFSATGGTSQVVKQVTAGAALTVARLACADLSDAGSNCTSSTAGVGMGVAAGQSLQGYGDLNQSLAAAHYAYYTTATLTAARTWTLPDSATQGAGLILIFDKQRAVTTTNTLTIQPAGTDTLDAGAGNPVFKTAGAYVMLQNDGAGKWSTVSSNSVPTVYVGATAGAANTYTVASPTPSNPAFTLTDQFVVRATISATNTSTSTLNVASTGAKTIKLNTQGGVQVLVGGELQANREYDFTYSSAADAFIVMALPPGTLVNAATTTTITAEQWASMTTLVVNTAAQVFTLPVSTGLSINGGLLVITEGVATTITPNASDAINSLPVNTSLKLAPRTMTLITTDGAGKIRVPGVFAHAMTAAVVMTSYGGL